MPGGLPPTLSLNTAQAAVQITRSNLHWGPTLGQPTSVTYAFRDSIPAGYVSTTDHQEGGSFQALSLSMQGQVTLALRLWADVAGITFQRVTDPGSTLSNNATMLFGTYLSTTDASAAFAPFPGDASAAARSGDVWLNRNSFTATPDIGDRNFMVIMHEIGHAIGLQHPGNYNAAPGVEITYVNDALYIEDTNQYTMMSYFEEFAGQPEAPLLHDIAAAQRLYGANFTTRTTNTTYGFESNITGPTRSIYDFALNTSPNFAIWDAGGIDTFNASGFTQAQVINLNPNSFSSVGGQTNNIAMAAAVTNLAGSVVNWIEHAIGGSGTDQIFGNAVNNRLEGRNGNDTLEGFAGFDTLNGGEGRDTASWFNAPGGVTVQMLQSRAFGTGAGGTDTLISIEDIFGSGFADNITGDDNANALYGFNGNDQLFGRGGNDTILGGDGNDLITETRGLNLLYGEWGDDTIRPGLDADVVDGGGQFDTVDYSLATARIVIDRPFGGGIAGFAFGDTYTSIERFIGTAFHDVIKGIALWEVFEGGDGNDLLEGGAGNDTLRGGRGVDTLIGGEGADSLDGGDDYDGAWFNGPSVSINLSTGVHGGEAAGDVFIRIEGFLGTTGGDRMVGNVGAHDFYGAEGNDTLEGLGGDDKLFGGAGDDSLLGGEGNDSLYGGDGNDVYFGGNGFDMASFADRNSGVGVDLLGGPISPVFNPIPMSSIEDIRGSRFNDVIYGRAGEANYFFGGDGNDTLAGRGGFDVLRGELHDDLILVRGGEAEADGGFGGFDTLAVDTGTGSFDWTLNSFSISGIGLVQVLNFEMARGNAGADRFVANGDNLSFYGEGGNDTLWGGSGDNVIEGAAGADELFFGAGYDYADYRSDTTGVLVDIRAYLATGGHATGDLWLDAPEGLMAGAGNDSLGGSEGDNRILGRAGNDYLSGYGGLDTLEGGEGNDSIEGGLGADLLAGEDGNDLLADTEGLLLLPGAADDGADDTLSGGAGHDTLRAGGGHDVLDGGTEDDWLTGGAGADSMLGGAGNDALFDHTQRVAVLGGGLVGGSFAGSDADTLLGGAGADVIYASGGGDVIDGGADSDSLIMEFTGAAGPLVFDFSPTASWTMTLGGVVTATISNVESLASITGTAGDDSMNGSRAAFPVVFDGGDGNDTLRGGMAADVLIGSGGDDRLIGGDGDDFLVGGAGRDVIAGGAGVDTFRWDVAGEAGDVIQGFVSGEDLLWIDASGFGGGLAEGTDLAAEGRFVLGGTATAAFGQFLYNQANGVLQWDADGTGLGARQLVANFGAGTSLAASDFLLLG